MATIHVYFNYKRDHRRIKLLCIVSMITILVFPIKVFPMNTYARHSATWVDFCSTRSLQHSTYVISSLSYTVVLHCLRKRYESLNLLLKNRFLSETRSNFRGCKSSSIQFIKFIGQQHCRLNDTMELVNNYAFQVRTFGTISSICWSISLQPFRSAFVVPLDYGHIWMCIYKHSYDILHIVSID